MIGCTNRSLSCVLVSQCSLSSVNHLFLSRFVKYIYVFVNYYANWIDHSIFFTLNPLENDVKITIYVELCHVYSIYRIVSGLHSLWNYVCCCVYWIILNFKFLNITSIVLCEVYSGGCVKFTVDECVKLTRVVDAVGRSHPGLHAWSSWHQTVEWRPQSRLPPRLVQEAGPSIL